MSFLKKLSEKVTPPKVNLTLNLKKDFYYLGEKLEGELVLSSDDDFDADEIRCELTCVESAKVQKRIYNPNLKHEMPIETWETATLYSAKPCLSGPIHVSKGFTCSFPFSIALPVTMKPTLKGVDRKVSWSIKGVVAVKGRPDATSRTVEVQVAQPPTAPITKEVIREVVMVPCKYCGTLFPQTEITCPHCGAKRTT
ncbi:MAG: hypothetical protein N3F10_04665 [Candidatus Bathyarchaeota archaeon]|nr:hypothetical protein [Candidatus Bathyarchaeota archaeon]MCX8177574.1 hypothetical protein [Candidatus Bathyarchaeota archaeon]